MFQKHCRLWHPPWMMFSSPEFPGVGWGWGWGWESGKQANHSTVQDLCPKRKHNQHPIKYVSFFMQYKGIKDEQSESIGEPCQLHIRHMSSSQRWGLLYPDFLQCLMMCFLVLQTKDHRVRTVEAFHLTILCLHNGCVLGRGAFIHWAISPAEEQTSSPTKVQYSFLLGTVSYHSILQHIPSNRGKIQGQGKDLARGEEENQRDEIMC